MANPPTAELPYAKTPAEIGAAPLPEPRAVEPQLEYVSGGTGLWTKTHARSLPWAFDDISQDFGDDIYERMLLDAQVRANVNVLKTAIIEDGVLLESAIQDRDDPLHDQAQEVRDFCDQALQDLEQPLDEVLWDLLDALPFGARVAEKVYTEKQGKLVLRALKVKPRRSTAFVVDAYMNVVGLLALIPGMGYGVQVGTTIVGNIDKQPQLLPKSKFLVVTSRPRASDPRGTSVLRPAYGVWWMKQQLWPEYLKYLSVWATPSLIGTTAERATEVYDPTTGTKQPAVTALLNTLIAFKNNSALAVPFGTVVKEVAATGTGEVFKFAHDILNREITTAILHQTLATMEGQHQARAASQVHENTLTTIVRQLKRQLQLALRRDVLRELVAVNFGEAAAQQLTPTASLGTVEQPDRAQMMTGVAQLMTAGYIDESQLAGLDTMLGLPMRAPPDENDPTQQDQGQDQGDQQQNTQPPKEQTNGSDQERAGRGAPQQPLPGGGRPGQADDVASPGQGHQRQG